jgi:hypothetical protein
MNANGGATTDAISISRAASRPAAISLRLPFAGPWIQRLLAVYFLLLLCVPANVLDFIGYDYTSIGGSSLTKIHVSSYFIIVLFLIFVVSYPLKSDLVRYFLATKFGTIYFFCAATFAIVYIVVDRRNGFGMYFDTDLHLALCCLLTPFVPPEGMDRLERFLHWYFLVNAALAIFELAVGGNILPVVANYPDGLTGVEPRATAFLSHPLHAATLTCVYIVSLLTGAGRLPWPRMRVPIIALQTAALLAFSGRTALLLTLAILAFALLSQALRFVAGKPFPRLDMLIAIAIVPVGIAAVSALAYAGLFDQFLDRFAEDGGSAHSRLLIFPLWLSFDWTDFLWGPNTDYMWAQTYSFGLEWGIENPFIQMSVQQGVVVASFLMSGVLLLLYEVYKRLDGRVIFPIVVFLSLCSSFGSFAGRFVPFAIFIVMISTLFRRQDAPSGYVH